MSEQPYELNLERAQVVLGTIREVCAYRGWHLLAAHVRTNHVQDGHAIPNRIIADLKAYASRALNVIEGNRKRWAREGSTRSLRTPSAIKAAVRYVADKQGEPMALYAA